jgi:hypothetical protein
MRFIALQGQGFLTLHGTLHLLPVISAGEQPARDTDHSVCLSGFVKNAWHYSIHSRIRLYGVGLSSGSDVFKAVVLVYLC